MLQWVILSLSLDILITHSRLSNGTRPARKRGRERERGKIFTARLMPWTLPWTWKQTLSSYLPGLRAVYCRFFLLSLFALLLLFICLASLCYLHSLAKLFGLRTSRQTWHADTISCILSKVDIFTCLWVCESPSARTRACVCVCSHSGCGSRVESGRERGRGVWLNSWACIVVVVVVVER